VRKDWLVVADTIRPSDVGLGDVEQQNRGFGDDGQGEWRSILPRWAPPISYLHLYECELFSVRTSATIRCKYRSWITKASGQV
jgi:hypothetical protein